MLAEFPSQNNLAVSHSCRTRLVTLQSLLTNASWILWRVSAPLEPSSSFIDSIDIRFKGFFLTSFPKIIFVIFYSFVVYEPVERNFYIPCMSRTQARKKIPFYRLQSFFTWLFLYEKEVKERVFSSTLHFAWQFSCKWNWWRVIVPQTQICKLDRTKFYIHRRDPFNQKFPEISFQTQWIGSVQPEKFRKKLVHLLRWTTFPGQTGQNFGWMDRTVLSHGEVLISLIILLQVLLSSWSSERKVHLFICVWLRTCSPISSWLERIRNSLICCRIQ